MFFINRSWDVEIRYPIKVGVDLVALLPNGSFDEEGWESSPSVWSFVFTCLEGGFTNLEYFKSVGETKVPVGKLLGSWLRIGEMRDELGAWVLSNWDAFRFMTRAPPRLLPGVHGVRWQGV